MPSSARGISCWYSMAGWLSRLMDRAGRSGLLPPGAKGVLSPLLVLLGAGSTGRPVLGCCEGVSTGRGWSLAAWAACWRQPSLSIASSWAMTCSAAWQQLGNDLQQVAWQQVCTGWQRHCQAKQCLVGRA
jgi:hypothetical protein